MGKGITKEIVLKEAEKILKKQGYSHLTIREIAASLEIKPASVYNHIGGISEVYEHISFVASQKLRKQIENAIKGKSGDEAFLAGSRAYRSFAEKNREMYIVLIRGRRSPDKKVTHAVFDGFAPLRDVILTYVQDDYQRLNFIRIFRSFLHGFVEITYNGFMQKGSVSRDETFEIAINHYLSILKGFKQL